MGSTSFLEVEAVEPLDPRHRDPHAEVVLLLGKVAEVVALVDLRLHVVGVDLVGGGVDKTATWEQHGDAVDRSTPHIVVERIVPSYLQIKIMTEV